MKASGLKKELKKYSSAKRKKTNEWFFKTGKGEYGEGDKFIGVRVPDIRKVAKQFIDLDFIELEKVLQSKIHEERLTALLILVENFKKAGKEKDKNLSTGEVGLQKQILKFYLKNLKYVNNWDLVDLSAHYILGQSILDKLEDEKILDKFSESNNLWKRRISIISTWIFIREGKINTTLRLSKKLLSDKEDLMHKAVGWMLREAWKKDKVNAEGREGALGCDKKVEEFLIKNYDKLPRTTLRYAIERMKETKRKRFLKGKF